MFSRSVFVFIALCLAVSVAFMGVRPSAVRLSKLNMKMDQNKAIAAMSPVLLASAPVFAASDALTTSMPLSLEVTFAAYLAVLLGTFVPVTFLIVLYSQSEARKAGARSVK